MGKPPNFQLLTFLFRLSPAGGNPLLNYIYEVCKGIVSAFSPACYLFFSHLFSTQKPWWSAFSSHAAAGTKCSETRNAMQEALKANWCPTNPTVSFVFMDSMWKLSKRCGKSHENPHDRSGPISVFDDVAEEMGGRIFPATCHRIIWITIIYPSNRLTCLLYHEEISWELTLATLGAPTPVFTRFTVRNCLDRSGDPLSMSPTF